MRVTYPVLIASLALAACSGSDEQATESRPQERSSYAGPGQNERIGESLDRARAAAAKAAKASREKEQEAADAAEGRAGQPQ